MVLIVLLNSVLSIMAMPAAGRPVVYGLVIILMLLVDGRDERVTNWNRYREPDARCGDDWAPYR